MSGSEGKIAPFRRIADDLRKKIESGRYQPGDHLPSASELMTQYGVAKQTVQNAMNSLRKEGSVRSRVGAGWFVAEPRQRYWASQTDSVERRLAADRRYDTFTEQVARNGGVARQVSTVEVIPASEYVAERLKVEPGVLVCVRRRVMFADDEPLQLGDSYYHLSMVEHTPIMDPADIPEGTNQVLADGGWVPVRCEDEITVGLPTPAEAKKLNMIIDMPVMRLARSCVDPNGVVIELYLVILPGAWHVLLYEVEV